METARPSINIIYNENIKPEEILEIVDTFEKSIEPSLRFNERVDMITHAIMQIARYHEVPIEEVVSLYDTISNKHDFSMLGKVVRAYGKMSNREDFKKIDLTLGEFYDIIDHNNMYKHDKLTNEKKIDYTELKHKLGHLSELNVLNFLR